MRKGFLWGAVLGSIAGGLTTLLFAPKAGKKFRQDLTKKYHQTKEDAEDFVDSLSETRKDIIKRAKNLVQDAKEAACAIIDDVEEARKEAKQIIRKKRKK